MPTALTGNDQATGPAADASDTCVAAGTAADRVAAWNVPPFRLTCTPLSAMSSLAIPCSRLTGPVNTDVGVICTVGEMPSVITVTETVEVWPLPATTCSVQA